MSRFPPQLDFQRLRRVVAIERLLDQRGLLDHMRARRGKLIGPCPVHGGDNPTAFVVDRARGLWFCHSGCRAGGDVVELVRRLDGVGYRQAALTLADLAERSAWDTPPAPSPSAPRSDFQPFAARLDLDPHHPLLHAKGIAPATAERFEVGAWRGRGMLHDCIAFRLHTPDGAPLGYAGRRLCSARARRLGKWLFPRGLPKRQLLYGWHRGVQGVPLVLVECPWGVLRLRQLNIPAVALLGTHLTADQARLLARVPSVLVMLDGDDAGRAATTRIRRLLAAQAVLLPRGHDPDDLTDDELRRLVTHARGCKRSEP